MKIKSDEFLIEDDDTINAGGVVTSGRNVRLLLEWFFPFGRPVSETIERLDDHLRRYPMMTAREWREQKENRT